MRLKHLRFGFFANLLCALFACMTMLVLSNVSYGDTKADIDLMYQYCTAQDYEKGFPITLKLAISGNTEAQYNLAVMYEEGQGVEVNLKEAVFWYQKSAQSGFPLAENNLGRMYQYGYGVEQSYTKAFMWYSKAVEQGNITAKNNLALLYDKGLGVDKDAHKAFSLYYENAEANDAQAQNSVGASYINGDGVAQSTQNAIYWFEKAAKQGNRLSQYNLGLIYGNGMDVIKDENKAMYWLTLSAKNGYEPAQSAIDILKNGHDVEQLQNRITMIFMIIAYIAVIIFIFFIFRLARAIRDDKLASWFIWCSLIPVLGNIVYLTFMLKLRSVLKAKLKLSGLQKSIRRFRLYIVIQLCSIIGLLIVVIMQWVLVGIFNTKMTADWMLVSEVIFVISCVLILIIFSVIIFIKSITLRKKIIQLSC